LDGTVKNGKHGMTPLSPVGFAQYGNYLALVRGEFEEGYRYVKLALSLMKQMPSRAHDGDIIYDSNHTKLVVEPMQSAVENYLEAFKAAMKNGATRNAMKCSFMYDIESFWSGKKLDAIVEFMKKDNEANEVSQKRVDAGDYPTIVSSGLAVDRSN
jgi:predicted ATPase